MERNRRPKQARNNSESKGEATWFTWLSNCAHRAKTTERESSPEQQESSRGRARLRKVERLASKPPQPLALHVSGHKPHTAHTLRRALEGEGPTTSRWASMGREAGAQALRLCLAPPTRSTHNVETRGEGREAATSLSEGHVTLPSAQALFTTHRRSNLSLLMIWCSLTRNSQSRRRDCCEQS